MFALTPLNSDTIYALTSAEDAEAAATLVPRLASLGIEAIFASAEPQAQATVAPFAAQAGLPVTTLPDLRDHRLSLQGNAPDDPYIALRFTQRGKARPGAETFNAAQARLKTAVRAISRRPVVAPLMVLAPGLLAALISGRDKTFGYDAFRAMAAPGLWQITHRKGMPVKIVPLEDTP
ncbi:MAG: histidine phosphatase family protein [Pseudomonadota bacterium]